MALSLCRARIISSCGDQNLCDVSTIAIAIAALLAPLASASAAPPVRAGILQCQGGQNVGFVVGSVTSSNACSRAKAAGRSPISQPSAVTASISASPIRPGSPGPSTRRPAGVGRGELAGNYGGVGANASVGVGFGGNFLVGGPQNAYALQPISVQGQTGLNVAAGIADIQLQPYRPRTRRAGTIIIAAIAAEPTQVDEKARASGPFLIGAMRIAVVVP